MTLLIIIIVGLAVLILGLSIYAYILVIRDQADNNGGKHDNRH